MLQLEQVLAPSVRARESLALEPLVAQPPPVEQVLLPAPVLWLQAAEFALGLALRPALREQPVPVLLQLALSRAQPQAAFSPPLPPLPSLLYPPWRQLPLRLPPRPVLKSFCELFRLRLRGSSLSASFFP